MKSVSSTGLGDCHYGWRKGQAIVKASTATVCTAKNEFALKYPMTMVVGKALTNDAEFCVGCAYPKVGRG